MIERPSLLYLLSGAGCMLVFVVAVAVWRRRCPQIWPFIGWGMVAWTVAVAMKVAVAIPFNDIARRNFEFHLGQPAGVLVFWLYIGLLTGIFECGVTFWFARKTRLRHADWNYSVAFGIGFGGFEAFAVGLMVMIGIVTAHFFFEKFPAEAQAQFASTIQVDPLRMALTVIERVSALLIHIFSCVAIVFAVRAGRAWWFWLPFAYKTLVDTLAVVGIERLRIDTSIMDLALFESVFVVLALVGLAGVRQLQARFRELEPFPAPIAGH